MKFLVTRVLETQIVADDQEAAEELASNLTSPLDFDVSDTYVAAVGE